MKNEIKLPPFTVEKTVSCLSETTDWGLLKYNVPDIWEITEGEGVTVYLLDTAGESDHIDLVGNIVGEANFTKSRSGKDVQGHGTHCAGIICAEKQGVGVIGVAPKAKIVLIKVLGDDGSGSAKSIAKGLEYAYEKICETNTPSVISMSLGSDGPLGEEVHYWIKKLYEKEVPIVCAVGNSGTEGVNYPAKYPETIAVGAFDENNELANFSTTGEELAFVAPGVNIYSTWPNGKYARLSGTCLKRDTLVYTTNGPKKMSELSENDYVYTFKNGEYKEKKIIKAWSNGIKEIIKIKTKGGKSIFCTKNHPFLSSSGEYIEAGNLKIGSELAICGNSLDSYWDEKLQQCSEDYVSSIEEAGEEEVWDIEVEDNHNFIANGFIVHNSMATPFMAGIVCLLLSKHLKQEKLTGFNDCKTCEDVRAHLIKHAVDMGEAGKDKKWGYGIVDLKTMMKED